MKRIIVNQTIMHLEVENTLSKMMQDIGSLSRKSAYLDMTDRSTIIRAIHALSALYRSSAKERREQQNTGNGIARLSLRA